MISAFTRLGKPESNNVFRRGSCCREQGALVFSLMMLLVIAMLGTAAAHTAFLSGKSARNDRDRQIAFQAAEAALIDAELDIEGSADSARSRSHIFLNSSALGFPGGEKPGCTSGNESIYLGLCNQTLNAGVPAWAIVDFSGNSQSASQAVPYGTFTGKRFLSGQGMLPARAPRYVIELFHYNKPGEAADKISYIYRVTAVGFGPDEKTQSALQIFYRKEGK